MSISAVGGAAGYPPPTPAPVSGQSAPPATKATDPDHDGDHDTPGRLDVKA